MLNFDKKCNQEENFARLTGVKLKNFIQFLKNEFHLERIVKKESFR
jgi:hypothetical protein